MAPWTWPTSKTRFNEGFLECGHYWPPGSDSLVNTSTLTMKRKCSACWRPGVLIKEILRVPYWLPLGIVSAHNALQAHAAVLGEMDDTYLLIKPDAAKGALEAVANAFAPDGIQVNARKSSVWCSRPVDTGCSGIAQVTTIPVILKQPLPTVGPQDQLLFLSDGADEVKVQRTCTTKTLSGDT